MCIRCCITSNVETGHHKRDIFRQLDEFEQESLYLIVYRGPHQETIKSIIAKNKFNSGGGGGGSVRSNKSSIKLSAKTI
jgi:hypothetical protein